MTIIVRSMGRPCLADAIASVAQQQHRPIELLVVDASGGSHPPLPSTPGLSRAELVCTGRRLNRPAAANVGLQQATGEWIGFLDDDDYLEATHVARLVARAREPDRPTLVYGQLWTLDRFHRVVHDRHHGFNALVMYYYCRTPGMSCILHRSLRDAGHRLDETLDTSEDWEFWLRLFPHANVATVRERTHFHFMEAGTSGTGSGRNCQRGESQQRCHDIVVARYAGERDRAWRAYFARLEEGIALHGAGRTDAAASLYADALRAYPDEPNALYLLGGIYEDEGRLHAARELLRQAIYLNGDAAQYHFALGRICERLEAYDEAGDAYASAARFDAGLRSVADEALARVAERLRPPPAPTGAPVRAAGRNAPCPCGSGLRFKACHGAERPRDAAMPPQATSVDDALERALLAARTGESREARALYGEILAQDPGHAEALHALALLEFDMGDVAGAVERIDRALQHAPADAQTVENRQRLRLHLYERADVARVYARLAALPFLVPSTASLAAAPHGSDLHVIAPFRDPEGDRECAALRLAQVLAAHAPVTLWSTHPESAGWFTEHRVREIDPARGHFPRSGALIFVGADPLPQRWLKACAASRIVAVHDADEPAALLDLVLAAHEATSCPVQIVMPSEVFRRRCGVPAASCPLPMDLERFRPAEGRSRIRRFTVGRRSRNDHRLFHPHDPALFRQLAHSGIAVRVLGGSVLRRHFPPSRPLAGLTLLAADALASPAFMRDIDCVFYRTSPLHAEAGGQSIAEALAAGIPVVCARDVGYSELIEHGADGFVFDRDDDESALRHLFGLQADRALLERMRRAARAKAEAIFGAALHGRLRRIHAGEASATDSLRATREYVDCAPA